VRPRQGKVPVQRQFRRDRMRAKLKEIKEGLRRRMHQPIPEQGQWLSQVVNGVFNDHAVPTNSRALCPYRYHVIRLWKGTLRRRSRKPTMTWPRMARLADPWLPRPRIRHPWPHQRFAVRYPRQEQHAGKPHVQICAGGAQ
jgi:hypothetical protein